MKTRKILLCLLELFNKTLRALFEDNENNTTRIRWNKTLELPFRYNTLYNEYKEKRVHVDWLNLPIEKAKYIVKGLIKSDGCIHKELTFDSTSENLVNL